MLLEWCTVSYFLIVFAEPQSGDPFINKKCILIFLGTNIVSSVERMKGERKISMATDLEEKAAEKFRFFYYLAAFCVLWMSDFILVLNARREMQRTLRGNSRTTTSFVKFVQRKLLYQTWCGTFPIPTRERSLFFLSFIMILFNLLFFHSVIMFHSLLMFCSFVDMTGRHSGLLGGLGQAINSIEFVSLLDRQAEHETMCSVCN